MIDFTCPTCGKHHHVKDELAGKKARCPGCQQIFPIPQIAQPEESPIDLSEGELEPHSGPLPASSPSQPPTTKDSAKQCKGSATVFSTKIAPGLIAGFTMLAIIMLFLPWIRLSFPDESAKELSLGHSGWQVAMHPLHYPYYNADVENGWMLTFLLVLLFGVMLLGLCALARGNVSKRALWICACVVCSAVLVLTIILVSVRHWSSGSLLLFAPSLLLSVILVTCSSLAWAGHAKHGLLIYAFVVCLVVLVLTIVYLVTGEYDYTYLATREHTYYTFGSGYREMRNETLSYEKTSHSMICDHLTLMPYLFLAVLTFACISSVAAGLLLAKSRHLEGLPPLDDPPVRDKA
jgi:hypothetical protein